MKTLAKYTTQVRSICEHYAEFEDKTGLSSVNEIIQKALPNIFDFDFPLYDESYRTILETKIIRHYYMREIGLETIGLWKFHLENRLNEIMPFYNQLYNSTLLDFNPLYNVDMKTTGNRTDDSNFQTTDDRKRSINDTVQSKSTNNRDITNNTDVTNNGSSDTNTSNDGTSSNTNKTTSSTDSKQDSSNTTTHDNTDAFQDTPQNGLTDVRNLNYLTTARIVTDNTTDDGVSTANSETTSNSTDTGNTHDQGTSHTSTQDTGNEKQTGNVSENGTLDTQNNVTEDNLNKQIGQAKTLNDYAEQVIGKSPGVSYSQMLKEFRETFLNIDMMIIDELADLFMQVY